MRFRRLQARIALPIIIMMLVVQGVGYFAISAAITRNARASVDDSLLVAERVFQQSLESNRLQLEQAANITAADFGFRKAVALNNRDTISSALANQADRIHASIAFLVSPTGEFLADTHEDAAPSGPVQAPGLFEQLQQGKMASGLYMLDRHLYQLVAVPVKAPLPLAWIIFGSPVDDQLATSMGGLTSTEVTFLGTLKNGKWKVFASSLDAPQRSALLHDVGINGSQFDNARFTSSHDLSYAALAMDVGSENNEIVAVVQRSLDQALLPYRHLQSALFFLTLLGVAISVAASVFTARRVVQPVMRLIHSTRRIGAGEYSADIEVTSHDEIGELATSFNHMRQGIAEREAHILDLAYRDVLTGLPNRALFNDRLVDALQDARKTDTPVALLMIDLDRFKYVNDTLGHQLGDLLLVQVGTRMTELMEPHGGVVARLGGDEFAVLMYGDNCDAAEGHAKSVLKALEQPFFVEEQVLDMTGSIGIVVFPEHGGDMNTMLRHADIAMYAAKRERSGFSVYQTGQDELIAEHLSLMTELRRALEREEFVLHYQPKVNIKSGMVEHVEALVRWNHPERGLLGPEHFIPYAEQTGFIRMITHWVMNRAIEQCATWQSLGLEMQMAINVSVRDLIQLDLPETVSACLQKHGVAPERLWIEITESALMDDPTKAIATLHRLKALGINLAIDDFGTGYSSLAYLKRLPVDELKIDKSFVLGMTMDQDDETIVRSTIDLGHNMGLRVVAEGVESLAAMNRLQHLGCDLVQGYYVSTALASDELEAWLADREMMRAAKTEIQRLQSSSR